MSPDKKKKISGRDSDCTSENKQRVKKEKATNERLFFFSSFVSTLLVQFQRSEPCRCVRPLSSLTEAGGTSPVELRETQTDV